MILLKVNIKCHMPARLHTTNILSVQHEATWFSASNCLLSGGGTLQLN